MSERDPLLEQLAREARARDKAHRADELFERLAAGTLEPERLKELERAAETDPELKLKLELFRPLGPAAVDRVLSAPRVVGAAPAASPPAPPRKPAPVRAIALAIGGLAALAASLWLLLPVAGPRLPAYSVALEGEQSLRGAPEEGLPRFGRGSTFRLVARPASAVSSRPRVQTFLVREGAARPWSPPIEVSAEGAVKIEGPVELVLPDEPGRYTAVVVLGVDGDLSPADVEAWRSGGSPRAGTKLEVELERVAP